jgi:membrane associated rhomboid family serine protease
MTYYSGSLSGGWTPAVRFFLIATGVAFILQQVDPRQPLIPLLVLNTDCLRHWQLWQLITYQFLHGDIWHFLFNMLGLFFFGPETERTIGTPRFAILYLASGALGGLGWLLLTGSGACLGASGAICGVLGAFAALFPDRLVTFLVFFVVPVTMRARTLAIGLGLLNLFFLMKMPGQIAYAAHLAGGLAGYGYIHWLFRRGFSAADLNPRQWVNGLRRLANDWRWRWQRRKFKVISADSGWEDEAEPTQAEVDAVLDKVSKWGLARLSAREREILERASRKRG